MAGLLKAILLWLAFPYCLSSTLRGPVKAANATHDLSTVKTVKTPPTVATAAVALWSAGPAKSLTQMLQEPRSVQHLRIQLPSAGEVTGHLIILATLMTAAALTFRYMAKWPEVDESMMPKEKLSSWSSGPFDCFEDMNICCWTCWCPGVRWAGNMDMMGFLKFWPAFFLFLFFDLMPAIPFCSCLCCGWCAVLTYYRNRLRAAFGMAGANECPSVVGDCAFVTCCTICAVSQEARHIQTAATVNHEAIAAQRPLLAPEQEVVA